MKYLYQIGVVLLLLICFESAVSAQENAKQLFKGTVLDEKAGPLPGVYVDVPERELGTITDADGKFELTGTLTPDTKITFTYLGYKQLTVSVENSNPLTVHMEPDGSFSERPIDLLYRTRPNYSVGAAAYTMYASEWRSNLYEGMNAELSGRMPGMIEGGLIRGGGTVGDRGILYLVDGMVMNHIGSLHEDDIESVTVLKDAAATAIYGLRGGNGIVSVRTKRGYSGSPRINVKVSNSINTPTVTPRMINSGQYVQLMNEASMNAGNDPLYSQEEVNAYRSNEYPEYFPNINWYDKLIKSMTNTQNAYISASGGGKRVQYYTSLGYTHKGVNYKTDGTNDKQYGDHLFTVRSNIDVKINDYISAYQNIFARIDRLYMPNASNIYANVFAMAPNVYGPTTEDGGVIVTTQNTSPAYGSINRSGYQQATGGDLTSITGLNADLGFITEGLSTKAIVRFYNWAASWVTGKRDYARYLRDMTQPSDLIFSTYGTSRDEPLTLSKTVDGHYRVEYEWNMNYDRSFGANGIYATGVINRQDYSTLEIRPSITMTYGFQAGYSYKNFLFADFNSSYQGSEKFAKRKRYGFFPSGDIAWVPTNHLFMDQHVLTFLKLKASYGLVGNDRIDSFLYEDNITRKGSGFVGYYGNGYNVERIGNPDITWEKAKKTNIGFEATLWNQFTLGLDYFHEIRTDILLQDELRPFVSGIPQSASPYTNGGKVRNQGVDMMIQYRKKLSKDFSLALSGNLLYNKNKVLNLQEIMLGPDYVYLQRRTGFSIGKLWGYEIDMSNGNGYFNTPEELNGSALTYEGATPRLGDFIYKDLNNDKVINDKDLVPMGNSMIPPVSWGATLDLQWRRFTLSFLFQGTSGTSTFRSGLGYYENTNNGTFFTHHLNAWTEERFKNGENITAPALSLNTSSSMKNNSFYLEKTDYVRLKNLKLNYTLPASISEKLGMKQLDVYFSSRNLLTFDNRKFKDIDVQMGNVGSNPIYRNFSLGLDVKF